MLDAFVKLRCSHDELQRWKDTAEESGHDLSTWIRRACNDEVRLRNSLKRKDYAAKMERDALVRALEREALVSETYPKRGE